MLSGAMMPLAMVGDDVSARDQRSGAFENDCDGYGAAHGQRICPDSRSHVVGHIIGTDVQRHISPETSGNDHDHRVVGLSKEQRSPKSREHNKDQRDAGSHQGPRNIGAGQFKVGVARKVAVQSL